VVGVPGGATTKSAIVVASVGTYSGPAASTVRPILEGAQLWVKYINHKGGLNGHLVKLIVYDDGAEPARHQAQVQDAIEHQHVIAFLENGEQLTGGSSVRYLEEKRVPVVGSAGGQKWASSSPMYFPSATEGDPAFFAWIAAAADQLLPAGKTKLGTLVCVEAAGSCSDVDRAMAGYAKGLGFEHVYRGRMSIAQPDFTAECLAARNAGAEALLLVMDSNSVTRVASSCARQAYHPTYATIISVVVDRFKDDPNLDGMVASTSVFPYFQSGTPATDEFQQAKRTFGEDLTLGVGTATGWTAGKLFERAGAQTLEPPTTEALLRALWSIKDDNLGGLTLPLTFVEGKPMPQPQVCWFNLAITRKSWVSPDGYKLRCREWKPSGS
jgi:branched-chain amino acid transport system substrate-binding protein